MPRRRWLCGLILLYRYVSAAESAPLPQTAPISLVWESQAKGAAAHNQTAYWNVLTAAGFSVEKCSIRTLAHRSFSSQDFFVIPEAAAKRLSEPLATRLALAVAKGSVLVTEGASPLTKRLGLISGVPRILRELHTPSFEQSPLTVWSHAVPTERWARPWPPAAHAQYQDNEGEAILLSGSLGRGKWMALADRLDPNTDAGFSRFPLFPNIVLRELGRRPVVSDSSLTAYVDFADHLEAFDARALAQRWRAAGLHDVYLSAWYYDDPAFDYAALVEAAHMAGLRVWAWLQWPHISRRFWETHPDWREKTATGQDAHVDWRLLMNLQKRDCWEAATQDLTHFLNRIPWDGVNIAELYFEPVSGPEQPELFTPLNADARREFQERAGFDPLELFQSTSTHAWRRHPEDLSRFYHYRQDEVAWLHARLMNVVRNMPSSHPTSMPVMVTTMDALTHPELGLYYGVDFNRLVPLLKMYGATLQIEDEYFDWALGPEHYSILGKRYQKFLGHRDFLIDVNVVSETGDPRSPTSQATGSELVDIFHRARQASGGVAFYSFGSIYPWDWELLPYAARAHETISRRWGK